MLLLFSLVAGPPGGIPGVNRLVLEAIGARGLPVQAGGGPPIQAIALQDASDAPWLSDWPGSAGTDGSRRRFALAALARRRSARGSTIFVTHTSLAPVGRLVQLLSGGRLAFFLHGVEAWGPLPFAVRWGLAGADLMIANSAYTLRRFREAHPRLAGVRGEICPLPARALRGDLVGGLSGDQESATPDPRPPLRVLVVGRLWGRGMRKGQKEMIALWPRIRRAHPGAELWVVGGGEGQAELEELARQVGVAEGVVFPGAVTDGRLARLYAASDLYAMPSWGEGFGLVFAEAMAHGLPCIASRLDAGAEVVVDGETGLLVDPQDPAELGGALLRLLGDPALRARLGEAGRRRVQELYSFESFAGRITALLGEAA